VPAIPLILIVGVATGNIVEAAVAAGAAFTVGFGAARDLRGRRWGAMLAAVFGTTLAAFIGSSLGNLFPVFLLLAALSAATCAALALLDEDMWWVMLQVVIALLISGYYAGPPAAAAGRAFAVLVGGTVQMACVVVLAWLAPRAGARLPGAAASYEPDRKLLLSHMLRAAICVTLALGAARALGLANSYWAPMTAMIVLKPGLHETQVRGMARLAGTITGCIAATLYAVGVGYSQPLLIAGVALTAGSAFALQKAHYGTLTCAITATVVLLLSLGHGGILANVEHRLIETVLGGVIALGVARIAPHRPLAERAGTDRVGS